MAETGFIRAAPYVRISTENQIENYSIEQQIERLESYCKAKDWHIYRIYTDAGYSGGNTSRPALQQLLNDINQSLIDVVIVYKLDRLSRSQKDTLTLIEDNFLKYNVDFVSVNENFDTSTPFGRAMIGILSVFAQLEKDQITERFTMGRIGRSRAGYYHGGPTAPTGYNYIDGELAIDDYKAMQVRKVYELFMKGNSINAIQRYMHEKYGGWSSHTLVLSVLRNSVYIGKVKFKGQEYDGVHEPILDETTYNSVRQLLSSKERENSKTTAQKTPFRARYLLSSLVYCGKCNARYSGNHGFYKCYSRAKSSRKYIIDPNCDNMNWSIDELDTLVTNEILSLTMDRKRLSALLTPVEPDLMSAENTDKRLSEIDKQMSKLIDLYEIDIIPIKEVSERITALQKEKDGLMEISDMRIIDTRTNFKLLLNDFGKVMEKGTLEEKRLFVSSLIERVVVHDNDVTINWRI